MNRILHLVTACLVASVLIGIAGCSKNGAIHDAAKAGDLATVKALLTAHPDLLNSMDTNGMTPLHFAAHNGSNDMVEFLLANKAEVNASDKYGQTPLHDASREGHTEVAKLLLANKAEVNAKDIFGDTPLHRAAVGGHKDAAELLLASNADVNAKDNQGGTPLHMAAMFDPKLMAQVRADLRAKTNYVAAPSDFGAEDGYKDVVELLLTHGADVNDKDNFGGTPLLAAAGAGHKDVAELLLADKADVNAKNRDGWTPLHEAAMSGHKDVAELLLANGADVNARDNQGETPLHMVLAIATDSRYTPKTELGKRNVEMVELLVASNADVNARDNNGSAPLDYPASNYKEFSNLLRHHGATNDLIGEKLILTDKDVDPRTVHLVATNTPRPNLAFKLVGKTSDEIQAIGQKHRWVQIMKDGTNVTETVWASTYQHQKTNYGLVLIFDDYKKAKLAEMALRGE